MLIRRPAAEIYEAFVDPAITTKFWFTKASGRLEVGATVQWEWEMYGVVDDVTVKALEPGRRILVEWPGHGTTNTLEWRFLARPDDTTMVEITESGFAADDKDLVAKVADSSAGFALVLAGAKAWLEHQVVLNLVQDRFPDGPPKS
jgi:uncharacterized protein YndB with AHSA1/START domain